MAFDYINEAFKKLELLDEQVFNASMDGINQLNNFIENDDNTEDIVDVIDPDASTEDELEDSYIGKVIVNCNVCHSHIFENKEDIQIDSDGVVNNDKACPYCGEQEGFIIVGEIAPYSDAAQETEENIDTTDDENGLEEGLGLGAGLALGGAAIGAGMVGSALLDDVEENTEDEILTEDFKEVSITTEDQHMEMTSDENGKVTVTTEPIENVEKTSEEVITPVSDETTDEILVTNDIETEVEEPVTEEPEEDTTEVEIDEIDEEGLNELGEGYLKKVYENVNSFKTTSLSANDSTLIVEGVITFNSGASKKTGFIFESKDVNTKGQLRFCGHNSQISETKDAFTLVGKLDNKRLFVESLKYNYSVDDGAVRGVIRRK